MSFIDSHHVTICTVEKVLGSIISDDIFIGVNLVFVRCVTSNSIIKNYININSIRSFEYV